MALRHLPANPRQEARAWNLQLGIGDCLRADRTIFEWRGQFA